MAWDNQYIKYVDNPDYDGSGGGIPALIHDPEQGWVNNPDYIEGGDPSKITVYNYPKMIKHPNGYLIHARFVTLGDAWYKRIPSIGENVDDNGRFIEGWYAVVSRYGEIFYHTWASNNMQDVLHEARLYVDSELPAETPLP